ncbi:MAG: lipocalin-like domain-containing protein [Alphaproteobacteria bacterium]|nr:lipocalin-like domain-containing protein [Alphaproteobacteria bacterium]
MSKPVADGIVGTWRLLSLTEQDLVTGTVRHPMGDRPSALVIYTADGHVATIFTATDRTAPAGPQPTDADAARLYRSIVAFAGRYRLDGEQLVYHPEISWNESWNGTSQTRLFEVSGDRLRVRSVPMPSTLTGASMVMTMEWQRATGNVQVAAR